MCAGLVCVFQFPEPISPQCPIPSLAPPVSYRSGRLAIPWPSSCDMVPIAMIWVESQPLGPPTADWIT